MPNEKIGVFDKEGKYNNPLTGKPYSSSYTHFSNIVHNQPLIKDVHHSYEILDKLRNNQVLVIESATGTGKTVVLPKLASHLMDYKKRVVVTVPKRSLAASSSKFCALCMDVRWGEQVGYMHKDSKITEMEMEDDEEVEVERPSYTNDTKVLFVTDGWLAQKVSTDLTLSEYGVIMIDEVHERNSSIDQLLLYLREALILNDQLKVIITSATLDIDYFANYFSSKGISVATKTVSGKTNFKVDEIFLDKKINGINISDEAFETYKKYLYQKNIKEDCIIFINSNPNAKKLCEKLEKLDKRIYCIVATSNTIAKDEDLENKAAKDPTEYPYLVELYKKKGYDRRVIVATEVWESSITLPLLKYVIEPGVAFISGYDGERMMYSLLNKQIAKGQVLQRKGRVGRSSPGTCIYLYSKKKFNNLKESKTPGILKEDFAKYLLKWWTRDENETLGELISFTMNLMDTPPKENIVTGLKSLYALGYCTGFNKRDDELTELGYFLAHKDYEIDGDIRYTKALYYASWYGCKDEVAVILALFSLKTGVSDLFIKCSNKSYSDSKKNECQRRLERFRNDYGDLFAALEAFTSYIEEEYNQKYFSWSKMERWAEKNYLNMRELEKIKEAYFKLVKKKYPFVLFEESGEEKIKFNTLYDKIAYCLLKGFYINLAEKKGKSYVNMFPPVKTKAELNDIIEVSRKKTKNFMKKESKYIIYNKLQEFDANQKIFTDTLAIPNHILKLLTDFEKEMVGLN